MRGVRESIVTKPLTDEELVVLRLFATIDALRAMLKQAEAEWDAILERAEKAEAYHRESLHLLAKTDTERLHLEVERDALRAKLEVAEAERDALQDDRRRADCAALRREAYYEARRVR